MDKVFSASINKGYPTVEGLPDIFSIPFLTAPYPKHMMRIIGNDYPKLIELANLANVPRCAPPYPKYMMRCIGISNDGYPMLTVLSGISSRNISDIYMGDREVTAMYFNGFYISSAFCRGKKVFGTENFFEEK